MSETNSLPDLVMVPHSHSALKRHPWLENKRRVSDKPECKIFVQNI